MDSTAAQPTSRVRELVRLEEGGREIRLVACWPAGGGTAADVPALAALDAALATGELGPGGTFVATVDGPGAVALARAAALRGVRALLVAAGAGRERVGLARAYGAEVRLDPLATPGSSGEPAPDLARRIAAEVGTATVLSFDRHAHWSLGSDDLVSAILADLSPGHEAFLPSRAAELASLVAGAGVTRLRTVGGRRAEAPDTVQPEAARLSRFPTVAPSGDVVVTDAELATAARRVAATSGVLLAADGAAALAAALRPTSDSSAATVLLLEPGHHDLDTLHDPDWLEREGLLRRGGTLTAAALFAQRHGDLPALVSLTPESPLGEAIRIMQELEVSQIPILEDDQVVGTLRDDQIIDLLLHAPGQQHEPVRAVMDDPLPSLPGDASLDDVQAAILAGAPAVLIRLPDGRLGILTKYDLIHGLSLT